MPEKMACYVKYNIFARSEPTKNRASQSNYRIHVFAAVRGNKFRPAAKRAIDYPAKHMHTELLGIGNIKVVSVYR